MLKIFMISGEDRDDLISVAVNTEAAIRSSGGRVKVQTSSGEDQWYEIRGWRDGAILCSNKGSVFSLDMDDVLDWEGSNGEWHRVPRG